MTPVSQSVQQCIKTWAILVLNPNASCVLCVFIFLPLFFIFFYFFTGCNRCLSSAARSQANSAILIIALATGAGLVAAERESLPAIGCCGGRLKAQNFISWKVQCSRLQQEAAVWGWWGLLVAGRVCVWGGGRLGVQQCATSACQSAWALVWRDAQINTTTDLKVSALKKGSLAFYY